MFIENNNNQYHNNMCSIDIVCIRIFYCSTIIHIVTYKSTYHFVGIHRVVQILHYHLAMAWQWTAIILSYPFCMQNFIINYIKMSIQTFCFVIIFCLSQRIYSHSTKQTHSLIRAQKHVPVTIQRPSCFLSMKWIEKKLYCFIDATEMFKMACASHSIFDSLLSFHFTFQKFTLQITDSSHCCSSCTTAATNNECYSFFNSVFNNWMYMPILRIITIYSTSSLWIN